MLREDDRFYNVVIYWNMYLFNYYFIENFVGFVLVHIGINIKYKIKGYYILGTCLFILLVSIIFFSNINFI